MRTMWCVGLVSASLGLLAVGCGETPEPSADAPELTAEGAEGLSCVTLRKLAVGAPVNDATIAMDPLDPTAAAANYGSIVSLFAGTQGTTTRQSLLRFDLSPIPANVPIASATLTLLKAQSTGSGTMLVRRVTAPWVDTTVTWSSFGAAYDGSTVHASFQPSSVATGAPIAVDISGLVTGWNSGALPNHGLLLEEPTGGRAAFGASDAGNVSFRPALKVCYSPPTCSDGLQNQGEAGVDCGGPCAPCGVVWQGDYIVSDAASAAGLAGINAITGALYLYHTSGVTTLPASPLSSIGTYLYVDHDTGLTSLSGLSNLQTIGGYLYVDHAEELVTLGLTSLQSVGAYVYLTNNPSLANLGLDNLQTIGLQSQGYGGYLYIDYDPSLTGLDLGSLHTVAEYLYVSHTPLTTLGLSSLTSAQNAWFYSNPLLPQCEVDNVVAQISGQPTGPCGFPATCSNGVQDGGESGLDCGGPCASCGTCFDGVKDGAETGADCGGSCAACATCSDGLQNQGEAGVDCGYPCAACVTCSDGIQNQGETGVDCGGPCSACPTCSDGIHNQGEIGVDCGGPCAASCGVVWYGDYAVNDPASAAGLAGIDVITGGLYMYHTAGVTSIPPVQLDYVGYVYVDHDSDLVSLDGLSSLSGVGGYVYLDGNLALQTSGLSSLAHVGGYVYVTNNPALAGLGLTSLQGIDDYLYVTGNPSLTSLDVPVLSSVAWYYVGSNASLPACAVPALDAQLNGQPPIPCP